MIVIKNNPVSEYYASITLPEWQDLGFNVQVFDAHTPDNPPTSFSVDFGLTKSKKYKKLNIKKEFTPTEKGCWHSHLALWKKCIDHNRHILVLEHDAYPLQPELINVCTSYDFVTYDSQGSGCYIISPKFAAFSWNRFVNENQKIILGPCGHVYALSRIHKQFKIIHWKSKNFIPASGQIHNLGYGSTISHYEGTSVEDLHYQTERLDATNPLKKITISTTQGQIK